jgi:protein TonB
MPAIVLLSLALHASLLLWLPGQATRPVIGEALLRLDLLQSSSRSARKQVAQPASSVKAPARRKHPPARHPHTPMPQIAPAAQVSLQNRPAWLASSKTPDIRRPVLIRPQRGTATAAARPSPASSPRRLSLAERQDRARDSLAHIFMKRFYYPQLASQRGWQGAVLLKVMIAANGQLKQVSVTESSGYTILDRAALSTMQSIHILPNSGRILQQQKLTLSFNVRYRLTDD